MARLEWMADAELPAIVENASDAQGNESERR
jgi:hypothetical protein